MREIGTELRQAREARDLTLEDIASRTLVAKKYLRALESGDFRFFPGEVYLKGALRKYAAEVGIDPQEATAWYEATRAAKEAENQQAHIQQKPQPQTKKTAQGPPRRRVKRNRASLLAAVLVLSILLVRATYTGLILRNNNGHSAEPPAASDGLPEEPPSTGEVPAEVPAEPLTPPLHIERDDRQNVIGYTVYNVTELQVTLSFTGRCWVSATADGKLAIEETFSAGQVYEIRAEEMVRIRVGYPPALNLVINGQAVETPASANPYTLEINLRPGLAS